MGEEKSSDMVAFLDYIDEFLQQHQVLHSDIVQLQGEIQAARKSGCITDGVCQEYAVKAVLVKVRQLGLAGWSYHEAYTATVECGRFSAELIPTT